ncbi:MAG: SUF system Fe-S cluster assembly protein [Alphaproteobacteria bacterium]|nr:MAG: SUF system Fe-S cluster assembly protein [Alphaproteobacteria bacterium]
MSEGGFLKSFLKGRRPDDIQATESEEPVEKSPTDVRNPAENGPVDAEASDQVGGGDTGDRALEMRVIDALREIYDPEIPVNIYELGLVYDVTASESGDVKVVMTLTTPHCPVAESMPGEVETRVRDVEGVRDVQVELVWDPPWDMTMMSEAARLELGFM